MSIRKHLRKLVLLTVAGTMLVMPGAASADEGSKRVTVTETNVYWLSDVTADLGWSRMYRTDDSDRFQFRSGHLNPRDAVTMWFVSFNNPAGCTDPCGPDDVFIDGDPALGLDADAIASAAVVAGYAGGDVAGPNGKIYIGGTVDEGAVNGTETIVGVEPVLHDARTAEIHLVARSHGPAIKGLVDVQLGSYGGGCDVFHLPGVYPLGLGECSDVQAAVHKP
jgi:hypothetical protein